MSSSTWNNYRRVIQNLVTAVHGLRNSDRVHSCRGHCGIPSHALDREQRLLAVRAHARTTRSEIELALRSSRTRTTVPSRIRRTIGRAQRADVASQSLFTLRHVRLTMSLPTVPPNSAASARRTRCDPNRILSLQVPFAGPTGRSTLWLPYHAGQG